MGYDFVKLCNCATCNRTLLGKQSEEWFHKLPRPQANEVRDLLGIEATDYVRITGRPYCLFCAGGSYKKCARSSKAAQRYIPTFQRTVRLCQNMARAKDSFLDD